MPYITLDDIKKSLPEEVIIQLTDDAHTGAVDQTCVENAIAQADAVVDAYCSSLYEVPFTTVPQLVKNISADIAIFNLYSRKAEQAPAARIEKYRSAIGKLEMISEGRVSLEPTGIPSEGPEANRSDEDRTFTPEALENF